MTNEGAHREVREKIGGYMQLLPCPFCGGQPLIDDADDGGSFIECAKCGASSAIHYDRMENLIPSWNRRALEADNERLRAALRDIVDREADASGGARLADFHDIGCACGRCAADIACAALEEK